MPQALAVDRRPYWDGLQSPNVLAPNYVTIDRARLEQRSIEGRIRSHGPAGVTPGGPLDASYAESKFDVLPARQQPQGLVCVFFFVGVF